MSRCNSLASFGSNTCHSLSHLLVPSGFASAGAIRLCRNQVDPEVAHYFMVSWAVGKLHTALAANRPYIPLSPRPPADPPCLPSLPPVSGSSSQSPPPPLPRRRQRRRLHNQPCGLEPTPYSQYFISEEVPEPVKRVPCQASQSPREPPL